MSKLLVEMTPQEWNSFLIEKYGFGLHPFALILCQLLYAGDITKYDGYPSVEILKGFKKKLLNIKKKIIYTLAEYERYFYLMNDITKFYEIDKDIEKIIDEEYELEKFFNFIKKISSDIDLITKTRKQGPLIKRRNLIVSIWALLIKEHIDKIEWDIIADLLDWFWNKLKDYKIYRVLRPKEMISDPEYLKNQFYRNRERYSKLWDEMKKRYFYLKQFKAKKIVFLGERINLIIDHARAFECYDSLSQEYFPVYEEIVANKIHLSEVWDSRITAAYVYFAAKILKNNPSSPPLIIFPDLSYLQ